MFIMHPHQLVSNLPQCNRAVIVAAAAATSLTRYRFFTSSINASSSSLSSFTTRYVNESERVFHMKRNRNTTAYVSYGGLQAAYIKNCGLVVESHQMVEEMNHDDDNRQPFFPWDDLLREYVKKKWLIQARHFFDHIMPQITTVSWHVLIQGYIMTGQMHQARTLFDSSPKAGTVWESMICGYARHDMEKQAVEMLNSRVQINILSCQMLIAGFFLCYNLCGGESTSVPRGVDLATWNLLIEGYAYYSSMAGATQIFEDMDKWHVDKNAQSWNLMITLFKHREHYMFTTQCYATEPFWKMPKKFRNSRSWNLIMAARSTGITDDPANYNKKLDETLSIFHVHMPENQKNAASWNTLIYAYLRRGMINEARSLFDYMPPEKNPHSWGLMIAGYLQNGMFDEAKEMFFDKSVRVYDDLHSWVLILVWFVKEKKMIDEARRFIIDNVPKRPLAFYSIACACRKHGYNEEAEFVLKSMKETMGTNLDIHQTMTFVDENLKDIGGCPVGQDGPASGVFMQILDPEVDSHGEYSEVFLKGAWDCCGVLQF